MSLNRTVPEEFTKVRSIFLVGLNLGCISESLDAATPQSRNSKKGEVELVPLESTQTGSQKHSIVFWLVIAGAVIIVVGMFYPLTITCFGCPPDGSDCSCVTNGLMTSFMIIAFGASLFSAVGIVHWVKSFRYSLSSRSNGS